LQTFAIVSANRWFAQFTTYALAEPPEGELGGGIGIIRNEAGAQDTPNPSKTHRTDGWFHDGALSKLLYLGAVAEARDLVANRRSASIPLPTIRQYADAQLIVFLVVNDGAGNQYELAAGLRGEAHAVAGIKGRLHTLAHFCVSMMERGLPHPAADLR